MSVLLAQPESDTRHQTVAEAESRGIDLKRLPSHVAVIMDGNGRWAKDMGKPRISGHRAGTESVREMVRTCRALDVEYLTLYAFSSENWKRPRLEIEALMILLETFLRSEVEEMKENGIRLNSIGNTDSLPKAAKRALESAEAATRGGERMTLTLALSYGGRNEIVEAAKRLAADVKDGQLDPEAITPAVFASRLMTADMPDPDLLIRTSGEMRVSNFLLWQIAYAEIWVTSTFWPDFRRTHLFDALADYQRRERRFGRVDVDGAKSS